MISLCQSRGPATRRRPPMGADAPRQSTSGDQVFPVPALLVSQVADAHQIGVLIVADLMQAAADPAPGRVPEGAREKNVPLRLVGPFLPDARIGARQAGDEGVEVAGRLGEALLNE